MLHSTITTDTLLKNPSAAIHSALKILKQHEITDEELKFKLALIQFFKNKISEPCITNLLASTPDIPARAQELFVERYKYIFSDFYYLSPDADRLNQLSIWNSKKHIAMAALTKNGGFLNPENSIDVWWSSSMDDYYAHVFALTCIKQGSLRYILPEEKQIIDDIQTIVEILTDALKEFGSNMCHDNTFHKPLKDACADMALALDGSSLSDEIKLELTSHIVSRQLSCM